jgi:hypothetical protein
VATAVALRRNVAWRSYSAISVIAAVAAFFFQLSSLSTKRQP